MFSKSDCDTDSDDQEIPNPSKSDKTRDDQPTKIKPHKLDEIKDLKLYNLDQIKDLKTPKLDQIKDVSPRKIDQINDSNPRKIDQIKDLSPRKLDEIKDLEPNKQHHSKGYTQIQVNEPDPNSDMGLQTTDILKPSIMGTTTSAEISQQTSVPKPDLELDQGFRAPDIPKPSVLETTTLTETTQQTLVSKSESASDKSPQTLNILRHSVVDTTTQKWAVFDKSDTYGASDVLYPTAEDVTSKNSQICSSETSFDEKEGLGIFDALKSSASDMDTQHLPKTKTDVETDKQIPQTSHMCESSAMDATIQQKEMTRSTTLLKNRSTNTFEILQPSIETLTALQLQDFDPFTPSNKHNTPTSYSLQISALENTSSQTFEISKPSEEVMTYQQVQVFGSFIQSSKDRNRTSDKLRMLNLDKTADFKAFKPIESDKDTSQTTFDSFKSSLVDMTSQQSKETKTESKKREALLSDVSKSLTVDKSEGTKLFEML